MSNPDDGLQPQLNTAAEQIVSHHRQVDVQGDKGSGCRPARFSLDLGSLRGRFARQLRPPNPRVEVEHGNLTPLLTFPFLAVEPCEAGARSSHSYAPRRVETLAARGQEAGARWDCPDATGGLLDDLPDAKDARGGFAKREALRRYRTKSAPTSNRTSLPKASAASSPRPVCCGFCSSAWPMPTKVCRTTRSPIRRSASD